MTRVWKVGCWPGVGDRTDDYKTLYIDKALENGFVAIGGAEYGDLSKWSAPEIPQQWDSFSHDIREGSIVLLYDNRRKGHKAYIGRVASPPKRLVPNYKPGQAAYYHVPKNDPLRIFGKEEGDDYAPNRVNVSWLYNKKPKEMVIDWNDTLHEVLKDHIRLASARPRRQKGRPKGIWVFDSDFRRRLLKRLGHRKASRVISNGDSNDRTQLAGYIFKATSQRNWTFSEDARVNSIDYWPDVPTIRVKPGYPVLFLQCGIEKRGFQGKGTVVTPRRGRHSRYAWVRYDQKFERPILLSEAKTDQISPARRWDSKKLPYLLGVKGVEDGKAPAPCGFTGTDFPVYERDAESLKVLFPNLVWLPGDSPRGKAIGEIERVVKGQGFGGEDKELIELIAMRRAKRYFNRIGKLTDPEAYKTQPYDFEYEIDGRPVYVEVKGTKGDLGQFVLTNREAKFARRHRGDVALFVVHNIDPESRDWDHNGITKSFFPWLFDEKRLRPISYFYKLN